MTLPISPSWLFTLLAAALTALALAPVLRAMLRPRPATGNAADQAASALRVLKEQQAELRRDLAAGRLHDAAFQQAMEDLHRRALQEGDTPLSVLSTQPQPRWALATGMLLVAMAMAGYLQLGQPDGITAEPGNAAQVDDHNEALAGMVNTLADRLAGGGGSAAEWLMLARSYLAIGNYDGANQAYERLVAMDPGNADALAGQAEALTLLHDDITPQAEALVARALAISPNHEQALLLAGSHAYHRQDYASAIAHWQRLLTRIGDEDPDAPALRQAIQEAQRQAGMP